MKKYYHDPTPFLYDRPSKWEFVISFLRGYGDAIEIVEGVTSSSDFYSRANIRHMLTVDFSHFECAKPIDRTVSLSPFLTKNEFASVCFRYEISKGVIDEIEAESIRTLDENCAIFPFIVFSKSVPIFWVNGAGAVFLLHDGEKNACQNAGCKLKEWDVTLNESLYGLVVAPSS
jgi:hypothetical protein